MAALMQREHQYTYMSSNEAAFVSCSVSDLGMPDNIEKCMFFYESSHGNDSQFSA